MPGLDDLPADQRAVLQLVLRKERSYAELAQALRIDEDAVRRRAHDALDALAPPGGAPAADRALLGDWLLGQHAGPPPAGAEARDWAGRVRAALQPVAARELPELPPLDSDERTTAPSPRVSRRGGAVLLAAAAVAIVAVVVVLVTRGGDSGGEPRTAGAKTTSAGAKTTSAGAKAQSKDNRVLAQVNLKPPKGAPVQAALGVVQLALVDGKQSLVAIAQGLKVTKGSSWGIWAEGGPGGRRWLGPFSQGDEQGRIYAQGRLEPNMDILAYKRLVVSRDGAKTPPKKQGTPYLTGAIKPPAQSQGG